MGLGGSESEKGLNGSANKGREFTKKGEKANMAEQRNQGQNGAYEYFLIAIPKERVQYLERLAKREELILTDWIASLALRQILAQILRN